MSKNKRFDDDIWITKKLAVSLDYDLYIALWPEIEQKVLIKHVRSDIDPEKKKRVEERLLTEATTLEEFWSPYFPKIYDIRRRDRDDSLYIICEFFSGTTLKELIYNEEAKLSPQAIKNFDQEILNALDYLHNKKKVVHLDLTPDNIIITKDGTPRIIDFENSKLEGETILPTNIRGKKEYMHPSLLKGESIQVHKAYDYYSWQKCLSQLERKMSWFERMKGAQTFSGTIYRQKSFIGVALLILLSFSLSSTLIKSKAPERKEEVIKKAVPVTQEKKESPVIPRKEETVVAKAEPKRKRPSQRKTRNLVSKVKKANRPNFKEAFLKTTGAKDKDIKECINTFSEKPVSALRLKYNIEKPGRLGKLEILSPNDLNYTASTCLKELFTRTSFPRHKSGNAYSIVESYKF